MNIFEKNKFKINYELSFLILVILSYFLGFYFNEDSSGGGFVDFEHEWTSIVEFKKNFFSSLTSEQYESSRTPLFLILNLFNPFNDTEYNYRLSNLIFNLSLPLIFYFYLKNYNYQLDKRVIFLLISTLFLSPYFRTSSFWAHQENLPIFFTISSFLYLNILIKKKKFKDLNILILAIIASLSFYSDQKYIFTSFFCFLYLVQKFFFNKKKLLKIFLIFFLTALPSLYLFYLWKGILPVQSQYRIGFHYTNFSCSISILGFYFLPILIFLARKKFLKEIIGSISRKEFILIFIFVTFIFFTIPTFEDPWGRGIVYKVFYILKEKLDINIYIIKILFFVFTVISSFFIYLILRKNPLNFLPIFTITILSVFVERTYQEYFDPIIFLLIFSFFTFPKKLNIFNLNLVRLYTIFYLFLLIASNIYYQFFNLVN